MWISKVLLVIVKYYILNVSAHRDKYLKAIVCLFTQTIFTI